MSLNCLLGQSVKLGLARESGKDDNGEDIFKCPWHSDTVY